MAAEYEFFLTPQRKDSDKVCYHARMVVKETVTNKELVRKVSKRCVVKEGGVVAVLDELVHVIREELAEGNSVHIDGLGSFRISAHSPAVRSRDELRAESIKFRNIIYTPEKRLRKLLRGVKFRKTTSAHVSSNIDEAEIDRRLTEHFKQNSYISTREMQALCLLTHATALRRLKERVKNGTLTHPGHLRDAYYFPVPGCYGTEAD